MKHFVPLDNRGDMGQGDFTCFYNELKRFALYKARRYFRDEILRENAVIEAMDKAVDALIESGCYDKEVARRAIASSLRQSSRTRKLEPSIIKKKEQLQLGIDDGFHGYRVK